MIFRFALGGLRHSEHRASTTVEEEKRLADLVKGGLAGEGFAVDVAYDGRDGLWMASENDYDAIVLLPCGAQEHESLPALESFAMWDRVLLRSVSG